MLNRKVGIIMRFLDEETLALFDEWIIFDSENFKREFKEGIPEEVKKKWEEWMVGFKRFNFLDRSGKSGNKE